MKDRGTHHEIEALRVEIEILRVQLDQRATFDMALFLDRAFQQGEKLDAQVARDHECVGTQLEYR